MKEYEPKNIRNVALAGHSGAGKTSLIEAILYNLKVTDRMGRVEEGNTVSDYDPEEVRRQVSINTSLIPIEHRGHKINFLDMPGYRDFVGEIRNTLRIADALVIVVDATAGVEVGTELAWEYAGEFNLPRMFVVNKIDRERASFEPVLEQIRERFGCHTVLLNFPVGEAGSFKGCVDLLKMKLAVGRNGRVSFEDIPAEASGSAARLKAELVEIAAEGDDELTEAFLNGDELSDDQILRGLKEDLVDGRACPVLTTTAHDGTGCIGLLDFIVNCFPAPGDHGGFFAMNGTGEDLVELKFDPQEPTAVYVFKTISDPFAGHLTFFKVLSGQVANDVSLLNPGRSTHEKVHHLMTMRGKKQEPVGRVLAGDIGVLAKLNGTHTNDTLCDSSRPIRVEPTRMPAHTIEMAVQAKSKEDEEKISLAMHRLIEQDPTLELRRDSATHQTILSGMGDTHLDIAVSRLKTQSKVEVELKVPRVAYRETIIKKSQGQGKHKKQSGGRGQYGDCWLRLEPLPEGSGFQFEWAIVGGVIPTKYQPSVEKGIVQAMEKGIVAGYPAVDIKATCYDGSYHTVDSSDMAFQIAASKAFKSVARDANPVILEPIYKVRVVVPEQYMGDVMGDLNSRRGRILGMNTEGNKQIIEAQVPLAAMADYSKQLRSLTQGRGNYEMSYDHYERVPAEEQAKIIAAAQTEAEGED